MLRGCRRYPGSPATSHSYIQWYILHEIHLGSAEERDQSARARLRLRLATLIFEGPTLVQEDHRRDYGEQRLVAVGLADGVELTVVFTDRVDAHGHFERRIISARRSNRHERQAYQKALRGT